MVARSEVEAMVQLLGAEKAKQREEGFKMLHRYMQESCMAALCTALDREEMWPTLMAALCTAIHRDALATQGSRSRRPQRQAVARELRRLVEMADERVPPPPFAPHPLRLATKVRALCLHMSATLPLAPAFLTDYCEALHALLAVPDYAARLANTKPLKDLMRFFLSRLELAVGAAPATPATQQPLLLPPSASASPSATASTATVSNLEAFHAASSVLALTRCAGGAGCLAVQQQHDMAGSFALIFAHLTDVGRLARKLLACVCAFLAECGANLAAGGALAGLVGALRGFVLRTWHSTRDEHVMEGLILTARMLLRLMAGGNSLDGEDALAAAGAEGRAGSRGGLQGDVLSLVAKELSRSSHAAGGAAAAVASASLLPGLDVRAVAAASKSSLHSSSTVGQSHWPIMDLAASLLFQQQLQHLPPSSQAPPLAGAISGEDSRPAKRRRTGGAGSAVVSSMGVGSVALAGARDGGADRSGAASVWAVLEEHIGQGSAPWLTALCVLLCDHSHPIPLHALHGWLALLHSHLARWIQDARQKGSLPTAIWALRCLEQLCMCLSASHLRHLSGQASHSSNATPAVQPHPGRASPAALWQCVWAEVTAALPALPNALVEPSLALLSALLQSGALQDVTVHKELLTLPQFKEGAPLASETLQFAVSLLSNKSFQRQEASLLALDPASTSPLSSARLALLQWLLAGMKSEAHATPREPESSHPITMRTVLHRTHRAPAPWLVAAALCATVTGEAPWCCAAGTAPATAARADAGSAASSSSSQFSLAASFHRDWWFPLHEDVRDMEASLPRLDRTPHSLVAAAAGSAAAAATAAADTVLPHGMSSPAALPPFSSPPWLAACQQRHQETSPPVSSSSPPFPSPHSTAPTPSRSLLDSSRVLTLSRAALSALSSLTCRPASGASGNGSGVGGFGSAEVGGEVARGEGEWLEPRGSAGSAGEGIVGGAGGRGSASSGGDSKQAHSLRLAAVGLHCCRLLSHSSFTSSLPPDLLPGSRLEKQSLQTALTALAPSTTPLHHSAPSAPVDPPSFSLLHDLLCVLPRTPSSLPLLAAMLRLTTDCYKTIAQAASAATEAAATGAEAGGTGGGEGALVLSHPPKSAIPPGARGYVDDDFDDDWEFHQPSARQATAGRGGARGRLGGTGSRSGAVLASFQAQQQQQQQVVEVGEEEARIFDNDLDAPGVPSQAPVLHSHRQTQSGWRDAAGGAAAAASASRGLGGGALTQSSGGGGATAAAEVAMGAVWFLGCVAELLPAAACREASWLLELNDNSECCWQLLCVLASHAELSLALQPVVSAFESPECMAAHSHRTHLLRLAAMAASRLTAHRKGALPPSLLQEEDAERAEGPEAWGRTTVHDADAEQAQQAMQAAVLAVLDEGVPAPAARIHLANALLALTLLGSTDLFEPLFELLGDRDYGVRLYMCRVLPALFLKWEDHHAMLNDTLSNVKTLSLAPSPTLSVSTLHLPSDTAATATPPAAATPSASPAARRGLPLLAGAAGRSALMALRGSDGRSGGGREEGEGEGAEGSGGAEEERVRREVGRMERGRVETSVVLLGRIAESSDAVEDEVVFLIMAATALGLARIELAGAVVGAAAASLGYPSATQYLAILLPSIAMRWAASDPILLPLRALAQVIMSLERAAASGEVGAGAHGDACVGDGTGDGGGGDRDSWEENKAERCKGAEGAEGAGADVKAWRRMAPLVLPTLLLLGRDSDVQWLAEVLQTSVPALLKDTFSDVFASLLPFRQSELDTWQKEVATGVLKTGMLALAGWSEADRDELLTKHMVPIIATLLRLTCTHQHPSLPYFPAHTIRATICHLLDTTVDSAPSTSTTRVPPSAAPPCTSLLLTDRLNILRPANVFTLLLSLHKAAVAACSPRHRCHVIAALSVLVDLLADRVTAPPTFRYLVHVLLACLPVSAPSWPHPSSPICSSQLPLSQSPSTPSQSPSSAAAVAVACLEVLAQVVAVAHSSNGKASSETAACAVLDQSEVSLIQTGTHVAGLDHLPYQQAIMSHVLALCVPPSRAAPGGELPEVLLELLRGFTLDAPLPLRDRLKLLQVPAAAVAAHPALAPIADSLSSLSQDLPLPHLLAQLASRAASLSPAVLAQSLQAACEHLSSRKQDLWLDTAAVQDSPGLDEGEAATDMPRPIPEALSATWQLLQLSRQMSESDPSTHTIRACLGRLLATLGLWDASAVSFRLPATAASAPASVTLVNADPAGEGIEEGVIVSVLALLGSLLVDPDVNVIQLAAQTIEAILMTERGHRVFTAKDFPQKKYLQAHIKTVNAARAQQIIQRLKEEAAASTPQLHDPSPWLAVGSTHEEWVRRVVPLLILHATDDILTLCGPLCAVNTPLAELLFPHVLASLAASHAPTSHLCRTVSAQLSTHILHAAHVVSLRSLQLLLDALSALRACNVRARMAPPPHTAAAAAARGQSSAVGARRTAAKTPSTAAPSTLEAATRTAAGGTASSNKGRRGGRRAPKAAAASPAGGQALTAAGAEAEDAVAGEGDGEERGADCDEGEPESPQHWQSPVWLQLDLLTLARAAQRCGASLSAILYTELWCEHRFGRPTLGEPSFDDESDAVQPHEDVLLACYAAVNEPDAIYAVARTNKLSSRLAIDRHEGRWEKVLQTLDHTMSHRTAPAAFAVAAGGAADVPPASTAAAPSLQLQSQSLQQGVMAALQHMACSHVLQAYWRGTVAGAAAATAGTAAGVSVRERADFLELQYEAAWKMGKWDLPAAQLAGSPQAHASSFSFAPSTVAPASSTPDLSISHGCGAGFHAALYSALKALHEGDCASSVATAAAAHQAIVCQLASTSAESALHINSRLVLLQALENVQEAASLNLSCGSGQANPALPAQQTQWQLHTWQRQLAACGSSFRLQEPLLSCRGAYLRATSQHAALPLHLLEAASLCRKAHLVSQATVQVQCLKDACRSLTASDQSASSAAAGSGVWAWGVEGVGFCGRVEEAKLLAAEGRQDMAVRLLQHLLRADLHSTASHGTNAPSASPAATAAACVPVPDRVYTLGLAAKWLGETRSISSRVVLSDYLWRAVDLTVLSQLDSSSAASATQGYTSFPFAANWRQQQEERQREHQVQEGRSEQQGGENGEQQQQVGQRQQRCVVYFQMARYVDGLFVVLHARLHSQQWQAAQDLRKHKRKEVEEMTKRVKTSRREEERRVYQAKIMELQKQLAVDDSEATEMQGEHDMYLRAALENYRECLLAADTYDIKVVFRLMALWFTLLSDDTVDIVNAQMLKTIHTVPSYKFLPLVYQIASRMSEHDAHGSPPVDAEKPDFQTVLTTLVKRMADDHPLHTVPVLLALANGNRVRTTQRGRNLFVVDEEKIQAAKAVLSGMAERHKPLLAEMQQLMDLYIRLAEMETSKEDVLRAKQLPRNFRSVRDLLLVPVLTACVPVDRTCRYAQGSFPAFCGLKDTIKVMHGVNAPKVVECVGSDGCAYKQLAKSGNDDLRQDAVMEQLFALVNSLLQAHGSASKRRLAIRTYKVVPFTPSAGVLEWVDGTLPLGEYLLGSSRKGGAHARYGGADWPFMTCREVMTRERDKKQAFDKVLQNFHPVMRHFFLERFLLPSDWFDHRLTYTRSVAATSMVGYVVGLGDRHSMNILLDERTAEVVHIDLGIAFEQGAMLKTPEKVPFRLTRDIIDGMGVCGVEGVFRRCCEAVLSVMRENKEALLTIIEVFIYDPLYKWALSPLKALHRQKMEESEEALEESAGWEEESGVAMEGNEEATRALLRVKQKLEGFEDGEMRSLAGQVQQLIKDAQDPTRLAIMFPGWGAWL
ncbi:hypothetical protein CLOM_g7479 [Closterium sp. NIES-68]|nr:hypothetical protein CLOM_g7479 [Closterium sp. NIES-68]GJP87011.1 hypothetical protein CLOP_g16982 [Closterium sp. NIES-67]